MTEKYERPVCKMCAEELFLGGEIEKGRCVDHYTKGEIKCMAEPKDRKNSAKTDI